MNPSRPRSLGYYVGPWGQREDKFRTQPFDFVSNVADAVSGVVPGTPAYPLKEAGAAGQSPYDWDGTGNVPPELYELLGLLVGMLGAPASNLPPRSATEDLAGFTIGIWRLLTTPTPSGCGLTAGAVQATIGKYEAAGPRAIAYALQELVRGTECRGFIKNPIADPTAPKVQDLPSGGSPMWPVTPGTQSIEVSEPAAPVVEVRPPATNGPPWGWIIGGVSLVALLGGGIYLATRKKRNPRPARRENPCACSNPSEPYVIETEGYELRENPYGSNQPLGGPAPATLSLTEPIREIPIRRSNPRRRNPIIDNPRGRGLSQAEAEARERQFREPASWRRWARDARKEGDLDRAHRFDLVAEHLEATGQFPMLAGYRDIYPGRILYGGDYYPALDPNAPLVRPPGHPWGPKQNPRKKPRPKARRRRAA